MSIYSGFATRQQETIYNKFVYKSLEMLAEEVVNRRSKQYSKGKASLFDFIYCANLTPIIFTFKFKFNSPNLI